MQFGAFNFTQIGNCPPNLLQGGTRFAILIIEKRGNIEFYSGLKKMGISDDQIYATF